MEMQRRAAVALLAFIAVGGALVVGVYAIGDRTGPGLGAIPSLTAAQRAFEEAEAALAEVTAPGVDLITDDPGRALELLNAAYAKLDEAEGLGYPAGQIAPLRKEALAGLDRLYGVEPVHSTTLFTFPAEKPSQLEALVRGSDGAPYVLDTANKTVWRIDLKKQKASAVMKTGQKASGTTVGGSEAPHHRRAGRPRPRREEQPLALAAVEQQRQGHAGPDQDQGLGVVGRRRQGHRDLRRQLRRGLLQAVRRRPVRAEHHGPLARQRRVRATRRSRSRGCRPSGPSTASPTC